MGVEIFVLGGFFVLCHFYQAHVSASDLGMRQKRGSCGGYYTDKQGTIESEDYPHDYQPSSRCIWNILSPKDSRIILHFISFQLESSSTCQFDALEVRDGTSTSSPLLGTFCGTKIPDPVESTGNAVTLKFRSDGSRQYQGFKIDYETVAQCGGVLVSDQGDITSPDYPRNYGDNKKCSWTITAPVNYQVLLRFRSFQLEASRGCESDFLEVYNGPNTYFPLLGRYCGSEHIDNIISSRNSMTVVFVSDESNDYRGFSAEYRKVKPNMEVIKSTATQNVPVLLMVGTIVCFISFASI